MYAIENGMRCDGMIHINRLGVYFFFVGLSGGSFSFVWAGTSIKKVSVFFSPCFIVTLIFVPLRSSGRVFCYLVPSSLPGRLPTTRIFFLG